MLVSGDDVDGAIQRLADGAASLTLDQRLRIAALLALPAATPEASGRTAENPSSSQTVAEPLVLTIEETAEVLRVGRTTVYGLIKADSLTSVMIGRLRRVRYSDIVAYLDQIGERPSR